MNTFSKIQVLLFCCAAILGSCRHDVVVPDSPEVSFSHDVQSIIIGNCAYSGCHTGDEGEQFSLITYEEITGIVEKGNARDSKLYQSVNGKSMKLMPPSPQALLTNEQISLIYVWIEQGAKNN